MGRIKTKLVKRVTKQLMQLHSNKFTNNFGKNKELVNKLVSTPSTKLRNIIAGYAVRLVKKDKEPKKIHAHSRENLDKYYKQTPKMSEIFHPVYDLWPEANPLGITENF